ncbi:hypothetical protein OSK79_21975 [Escherichia coli]|nr:hypothetical protein [Escherichia coli]
MSGRGYVSDGKNINGHIQVATSFRSGTVQRLHISEHGKICAKYPAKAKELRTGTLNAVSDECIIFDESTAEGVGGDFYEMSTVDGVLGMEAKTRTDLLVISDDPDDETEKLAEAINAEFADACRLGNMNKARSDAYAEQIKAGLSWVEVRRNSDPFGPEFKVSTVSRNEVFWDWLSREADLSDCRWLMRRRWMDTDEAKATFPGMAQVIDYAIDDWRGFVDTTVTEGQPSPLMSAWEEYQSWDRQQNEWLQRERRRVLLQVVYYRTFERLPVIELSNGRVVAFDKNNLMHAVAVASGRVQVRVGRVSRIREAWFVGPHFIVDRPCSAPQGMFPLVPFWGYRKDKTGEPYGLISRAIPAQDEVNFRRIKLTWLLQAKRVIMDEDATQLSDNDLMEQIERPDGIIKLNPARKNQKSVADVFRVEQDFQVASQQFQVMQESEKLIQDTMGVIRPGRVMHFACSPGEVSVLYAVAPKAGSRQVQDELRAWSEEVAAGALERLFMQTGVSWSDPSRAQYFSVLFSEGIRRAYRDTLATSPYSSYRNPVRRQRFY